MMAAREIPPLNVGSDHGYDYNDSVTLPVQVLISEHLSCSVILLRYLQSWVIDQFLCFRLRHLVATFLT